MINPFKFIQSVKNEAFRVSWPTGKETLTGAVMVVLLAIVAAIFFLILDQILKFLLNFTLTISF
ncbi:MAG: preprotein translocase subunit SecE [Alphaproteobacteria bacterium]|jgi:preprotein translocase subunit SecE|nr:preprotein translocase subunit SecE [Alphaproteobacteria bacterium]